MAKSHHRALLRFVTLLCLSAGGSSRVGAAEPLTLEWNAPAGCPSASEVRARIRTLAVDWPPRGEPLTAAATIERSREGRFHMRLVVRAGDLVGQRVLEAAACESLASAAAVHVALLLNGEDPSRVEAPPGATPTTESSTPAAAPQAVESRTGEEAGAADAADGTVEEASSDDPDSSARTRLLLQVPRASLQLGPLPEPSLGLSAGAGLMFDAWRLIVAAHVWLERTVSREDQPEIRASVDRLSAQLRLCRAATWNQFELAPCAKVSLEHVWARGSGADVTARTATATWVAAGAGVQARLYVLPGWAALAEADFEFEAARPEVYIDGLGRLGKLGPAAFTLTLGSELIL